MPAESTSGGAVPLGAAWGRLLRRSLGLGVKLARDGKRRGDSRGKLGESCVTVSQPVLGAALWALVEGERKETRVNCAPQSLGARAQPLPGVAVGLSLGARETALGARGGCEARAEGGRRLS